MDGQTMNEKLSEQHSQNKLNQIQLRSEHFFFDNILWLLHSCKC